MNKVIAWLLGIAVPALAALKYRGDIFKEKAKSAEKQAKVSEEIIQDVKTTSDAVRDDTKRDGVRDKYTVG